MPLSDGGIVTAQAIQKGRENQFFSAGFDRIQYTIVH
jgi:hypothetical protein